MAQAFAYYNFNNTDPTTTATSRPVPMYSATSRLPTAAVIWWRV